MANTTSSRVFKSLLPILGGAAAGLLTAWFAAGSGPRSMPSEARSVEREHEITTRSTSDSAARSRLAALERTVSDIQAQERSPERDVEKPPSRPAEPEEERRAVTAVFQRAMERHDAEPRAGVWAARASERLGSDLTEITRTRHFTVDQVDCRSRSCVATLTWSNYREASETTGDLLHRNYGLNCGRMVLMPEPRDAAVAYTARVVFECANPEAALGDT